MPRPQKGQKAKSIAELEKRLRNSSKYRLKWLRSLASGQINLPDGFKALTMESFCEYDSESLGFIKVSPNTFKKHLDSDNIVAEVKDILSSLRNTSSTSVKKRVHQRRETRSSWDTERQRYQAQIQALTDDLITLRTAYLSLLNRLDDSNTKNKLIQNTIKEHRNTIGLRFIPDVTND